MDAQVGSVTRWKTWAAAIFVVVAPQLVNVQVLRLYRYGIRAPLEYLGDSVFTGALIKTVLERGWYLDNPSLGVPGALNMRDFPGADFFHYLALKLLGLFGADWALALNLYFLLSASVTALVAWLVLRRLGVSELAAAGAAVLYSSLPYYFMRGEGHLFLTAYYVVPIGCYLALRVMEPVPPFFANTRFRLLPALGCVLAGGCGIYYAFFTCFLVAIAGLIAALRRRVAQPLLSAGIVIAIVCAVVALNLLPSVRYTAEEGANTAVAQRSFAESEMYGLKLSQLVLPVTGHRIAALKALKDHYNEAPLRNENDSSALGVIGAIGFLALLLALVWKRLERFESLAALNLACVLLGTIGGLGTIFALIVSPQIRAYNRVSIFIAFFSLAAAALLFDQAAARLPPIARVTAAALLVFAGLYDQTSWQTADRVQQSRALYEADAADFAALRPAFHPGCRVFELPYFPFPEQPRQVALGDYQLFVPYLHIAGCSWSYGAMRGRAIDAWQARIAALPPAELVESVALAGFDTIYVDGRGYEDSGRQLDQTLASVTRTPPVTSPDGVREVFSLARVRAELRAKYSPAELAAKSEAVLPAVVPVFAHGFYPEERDRGLTWHWSQRHSELVLDNLSGKPADATIEMVLISGDVPSRVVIQTGSGSEVAQATPTGTRVSLHVTIPEHRRVISFTDDGPAVVTASDPRSLVFRVAQISVHTNGALAAERLRP